MISFPILTSLASALICVSLAPPSPQSGGAVCVDSGHFSLDGGPAEACPGGTVCTQVSDGSPCVAPGAAFVETAGTATATLVATVTATGTATKTATAIATGTGTATTSGAASGTVVPLPSMSSGQKRFVAYWSVWSGTGVGQNPTADQLKSVTHLVLAFPNITTFAGYDTSSDALFDATTPAALRLINPNMVIMGAFGGWNQDLPFRPAVQTDQTRQDFANKIGDFCDQYDLQGADMDWEYPVQNGAQSQVTGPDGRPPDPSDKANYVLLLQAIRQRLGSNRVLSVAIPCNANDSVAFDSTTIPQIEEVADFWNVMTYDAVNRGSSITGYHAGGGVVESTLAMYTDSDHKMTASKMNIGFPMYAKWFSLGAGTACPSVIGCPMGPFDYTVDNGSSGFWTFNQALDATAVTGMDPTLASKVGSSWTIASTASNTDNSTALCSAYYDETNGYFWTWTSTGDTQQTCQNVIGQVGGIMAWSIDQDEDGQDGGPRFSALASCASGAS